MVSDKYEVILSAKAYDDLDKIYEDVLSVSKDIDTAEKYLSSIKERILGLEDNPHNHPIRKYGSIGYYDLSYIIECLTITSCGYKLQLFLWTYMFILRAPSPHKMERYSI